MPRRKREHLQEAGNTTIATAKDKLSEELGLPRTITAGLNYMEMLGNKEAVIDGCKGILDYSDDKIKLNLGNKTICFLGSNMCIKALSDEQAVITGTICSIEFG